MHVSSLTPKVGLHVSISKSLASSFDIAKEIGCDTFQIFTRNPRGWKFKHLLLDEIKAFKEKQEQAGITPVLSHMPYLPNLASPNRDIYKKSVETLTSEVDRCGKLGIQYVVTHLGSHLGEGQEMGLARLVAGLNTALSKSVNQVQILLENMAGQKNSMGSRFEEIERIIERVDQADRIGVCFDTCHAFAAGYELRSEKSLNETLSQIRKFLGVERIKAVHLNDSQGGLGSGLDRHEHIGLGYIGTKGFKLLLQNSLFRRLPLILETPIDDRMNDRENLNVVRKLAR